MKTNHYKGQKTEKGNNGGTPNKKPSRLKAVGHTKKNPYETTTTEFIRKHGGTVGKSPSADNKVFERGGGALVKDLNGLETSDGRETVVQLHKQGRGQAHKLYAYLKPHGDV